MDFKRIFYIFPYQVSINRDYVGIHFTEMF